MTEITIKRWDSGEVIICGKYESIKDCLEKNRGSNLRGSNLRGCNLRESDLSGSDLRESDLRGSDFYHTANLGELSDKLILELMRWDATICGMELMNEWAKGGSCPFDENKLFPRLFCFEQDKNLWKPGKPTKNLRQVYKMILDELKIKR